MMIEKEVRDAKPPSGWAMGAAAVMFSLAVVMVGWGLGHLNDGPEAPREAVEGPPSNETPGLACAFPDLTYGQGQSTASIDVTLTAGGGRACADGYKWFLRANAANWPDGPTWRPVLAHPAGVDMAPGMSVIMTLTFNISADDHARARPYVFGNDARVATTTFFGPET